MQWYDVTQTNLIGRMNPKDILFSLFFGLLFHYRLQYLKNDWLSTTPATSEHEKAVFKNVDLQFLTKRLHLDIVCRICKGIPNWKLEPLEARYLK